MHINYSDPINKMTDVEAKAFCHLILGLDFDHTLEETRIGSIVKALKIWHCTVNLHEIGEVTIIILNWPNQIEIKAWNLEKAFLQASWVLGKWRPDLVEPPETPKL